MAFLFRGRNKTPAELVKGMMEAISTVDEKNEECTAKALEKVSENLKGMRFMFYGDTETDPKPENIDKLVQEILATDVLLLLLQNITRFDFEAKKDIAAVFTFLVRRSDQNSAGEYILSRPQMLLLLVSGYEDVDVALNCGSILRECIRHPALCKMLLETEEYFFPFFDHVQESNFDVASDAFATLKLLLTKHKEIASKFLEQRYDAFFAKYNLLIQSNNYVTKRQSLKLLGEILLDRNNFTVMIKYINDPENLKLMMILLQGKSKIIQFEAFHVFKVFVANPQKSQPVLDILTKNKDKLVEFLQNFQTDKGMV